MKKKLSSFLLALLTVFSIVALSTLSPATFHADSPPQNTTVKYVFSDMSSANIGLLGSDGKLSADSLAFLYQGLAFDAAHTDFVFSYFFVSGLTNRSVIYFYPYDTVVTVDMLSADGCLYIKAAFEPPAADIPDDTADGTTDDYCERHYETWVDVLSDVEAIPDNGTYTINMPIEIDHIQHFVFDALAGTNKTLIVIRDGITYRINGRNIPESMLGHNQLFVGNLECFIA